MIFHHIPSFETPEDAERWAEDNGVALLVLEKGPDGLLRGLAREDLDSGEGDLARS